MIGWLINRLSGYQRDRVFYRQVYALESTRLVTDANGMLSSGETVASAVWLTQDGYSAVMIDPEIAVGGKSVSVNVTARDQGRTRIRADITTTAGRVISAWHVLQVQCAPYVGYVPWTPGPTRLEVVA